MFSNIWCSAQVINHKTPSSVKWGIGLEYGSRKNNLTNKAIWLTLGSIFFANRMQHLVSYTYPNNFCFPFSNASLITMHSLIIESSRRPYWFLQCWLMRSYKWQARSWFAWNIWFPLPCTPRNRISEEINASHGWQVASKDSLLVWT